MKNNPVIPYILIMAFGIGLIFFLSLTGAGHDEAGGETDTNDDAKLVQSCISCHGGNLEGQGTIPKLIGLEPDYIMEVLANGIEGTPMTAGMVNEATAKAIAEYISSLE